MSTHKRYYSYLIESLKDPVETAAYLDAVLEDGDLEQILLALKNVAEVLRNKIWLKKIDEHFSLEEKVWTKLQRLPPAQQQMILSYVEFLLSQVNQKSQDSNLDKRQMFVETCGAWQDEPCTAEDLVKTVYSDRTISSQEYSL
ncbi:MAG: DUF2281 domain-containing protein [Symploca sp. SIO1B1]|nr:DUF2281 domain-containing protein [Symploca sp. SIO1B1]